MSIELMLILAFRRRHGVDGGRSREALQQIITGLASEILHSVLCTAEVNEGWWEG